MAESVERAMQILVVLGTGPTSISELARRLDVHRSTALRLLRTLEGQRFVRRNDDGSYGLGPAIRALSQASLEEHDVRAIARSHLNRLGATHGHTVHLAALHDRDIVYLDKVESRHVIRMYSRIGATAPVHATGVGKAILAFLAPEIRDDVLGPEPYARFTPNTLTARSDLDDELASIRERGWAFDEHEHEEFIHCVSAPVFDARNEVVAAISISVPQILMECDDLASLVPELLETTTALSQELGWPRSG